jgi:hypothetical protein
MVIQRPRELTVGAHAGGAKARVVEDLSEIEVRRMFEGTVEPTVHLMSDE